MRCLMVAVVVMLFQSPAPAAYWNIIFDQQEYEPGETGSFEIRFLNPDAPIELIESMDLQVWGPNFQVPQQERGDLDPESVLFGVSGLRLEHRIDPHNGVSDFIQVSTHPEWIGNTLEYNTVTFPTGSSLLLTEFFSVDQDCSFDTVLQGCFLDLQQYQLPYYGTEVLTFPVQFSVRNIPEPASIILFLAGLIGVFYWRRRRCRQPTDRFGS